MRYAVVKICLAEAVGISPDNHFKKGEMMIVNEKEVKLSEAKGDTFEDKVASLEGEIKSKITIKKELKHEWKI